MRGGHRCRIIRAWDFEMRIKVTKIVLGFIIFVEGLLGAAVLDVMESDRPFFLFLALVGLFLMIISAVTPVRIVDKN